MGNKKANNSTVLLIGGPLDGLHKEVPKGTEVIHFGPKPKPFFTYTYAGRQGNMLLFAKKPKSRAVARFNFWYVGKVGQDPRVLENQAKKKPYRRKTA